jgi:hypothetical protein
VGKQHFDLTASKIESEKLHLYFEEKNNPSKEFNHLQLASKGFLNEIMIQDFPLRGKFVFYISKDVIGLIYKIKKSFKETGILLSMDPYNSRVCDFFKRYQLILNLSIVILSEVFLA